MIEDTTPQRLSAIGRIVGKNLSFKERLLMRYRPYICPFHVLLQFIKSGSRVYDIGCGTGLWLYLLSRLGIISSGVGIEIVAEKIAAATSLKSSTDNLEFLYVPADRPWPDAECDCITMIDVLHHVPRNDQQVFMRQVCQSRATTIVFKDIDPAAKVKSMMNSLHDLVLSRQLPRYCPRRTVAKWLEESGFSIVCNRRCDMLWYSHYVIVAERK